MGVRGRAGGRIGDGTSTGGGATRESRGEEGLRCRPLSGKARWMRREMLWEGDGRGVTKVLRRWYRFSLNTFGYWKCGEDLSASGDVDAIKTEISLYRSMVAVNTHA